MKTPAALLGLILALAHGQAIGQEMASSEADDQFMYAMSFTAPAMAELCTPLLPNYRASVEASLQSWRVRNSASIERGKQVEIAHLWPGKTIEEFEQLTIEATKDSFKAVARERQFRRCQGTLISLSSGTDTGGA